MIDQPGGSISGYVLAKGDPSGMSDEEAPGLRAGAKRTNDLRTPPRLGFGALADHEGDTEEEDEWAAPATDLNTSGSGLASAQAKRGQITPISGHRYPAASPAHRREDVSMGRRSPQPPTKGGHYPKDAGHPARHATAAAAPAPKTALEGNAPAALFSGFNRGSLSHPANMAKGSAPAVNPPWAPAGPHPGKDPPKPTV